MSVKSACLCQKGAFAGGRGAVSASKSAVKGEESVSGARRTSLQTERAPYLLRMMHSYAKRALFCDRTALSLVGWAPYLLRRAPQWVERAFFVPEESLHSREVAISA